MKLHLRGEQKFLSWFEGRMKRMCLGAGWGPRRLFLEQSTWSRI